MKPLLGMVFALGVASAATATTVAVRSHGFASGPSRDSRPGPDSARVAALLGSLTRADPVACEMIADQVGNFWWSDGGTGVGLFEDVRAGARLGKDSLAGEVRDPRAVTLLAATLGTDDPCVRLVAAKILGNTSAGDDEIARALGASSARVREAALRAAGERDRLALRGRVERMLDDEAAVAAMAAWALGEWEQKASVPALTRALANASPRVRAAGAHALGEIEDASVADALERLIANDGDRRVRLAAVRALGDLDLPDDSPAPAGLLRAVEGSDAEIRYAALQALMDYDDEKMVPMLLGFITDPDADVRMQVIEHLGSLGATQAVPAIKRALDDPVADVRRAAVEALAEIDDR